MDFQAIVLAAGKGSRMTDLTLKCSKALLPVGCRPMIWHALNLLQRNGFKEAIVVLPALNRNDILTQIQSCNDLKLKLTEEIVQNVDEITETGTADVLRDIIKSRDIKKDLLVVSSDLITETSLDQLLALHYVRNSSLTALFTPITQGFLTSQIPGPKTKLKVEKDLVGIECENKRLMFVASETDFENEMTLKRRVLKCCPRFEVHGNLQDAHLYLISKSTFGLWVDNKEINSIKGDLIPYLCRKQFFTPKDDVTEGNIFEMSSWNGAMNRGNTAYSCYGYIDRQSFSMRANNLSSYMYSNKQMLRLWCRVSPDPIASSMHPSIQIGEKSMVANDCCVWKGVSVGNQSTIRSCVIGAECKIGSQVKLTNCVLMDKVAIGDGCVLQGCIVCRDAVVHEKSNLNNCVVAVEQVPTATRAFNEIITDEDSFMEI